MKSSMKLPLRLTLGTREPAMLGKEEERLVLTWLPDSGMGDRVSKWQMT
jgi:hypothetical protein